MTDASSAPSTDPVAASPVAAPRIRPSALLLTLALLVVSAIAAWQWSRPVSSGPEPSAAAPVVPAAPVADPRLERALTQLADLERVNSVLRQQVVALTERVAVLGEQQSLHSRNLGEQRQDVRGQTALALAEQWLNLAQARLELFADPAGALQALDAADRALQGSSHPRVPSLRQTLSIERESLRVLPLLDTARVAGQLEAWQQALPSWPERTQADAASAGSTSNKVLGKLDRYFRVRPLSNDVAVAPDLATLGAELAWARVLLARGERAALHVSLQRVAAAIEQRFDTDDSGVQAALSGLQELIANLSGNGSSPRLGISLQELRVLESEVATPAPPAQSRHVEPSAQAEQPAQPPEPAGVQVAPLPAEAAERDSESESESSTEDEPDHAAAVPPSEVL